MHGQFVWEVVTSLWALGVLVVIILTRHNVWLQRQVYRFVSPEREAVSVVVYSVPFTVIVFAAAAPVTIGKFLWSGEGSWGVWIAGQGAELLALIAVNAVLYSLLYLIIRITGRWWWLGVTGLMLVVLFFYDVVKPAYVDPAVGGYEQVDGVWIGPVGAHGFAGGLGRQPRVVLSPKTMDRLTADERAFVKAHAVAHHQRGHVWARLALSLVVIAIGMFLVDRSFEFASKRWPTLGVESLAVPASLPIIIVVFSAWSLAVTPIENGLRRVQHHWADRHALATTEFTPSTLRAVARKSAEQDGQPFSTPFIVELFQATPSASRRERDEAD